jgi:cyclophilin family peptidyl-prolyl cis-trans isomerase
MTKLFLFCLLVSVNLSALGQAEKHAVVTIKTDKGTIVFLLHNETPLHRDNFVKLCKKKFYDKTTFHRVIKDFMVQGGDPYSRMPEKKDSIGNGGPGYTIPAEFTPKVFHQRGAVAAARMGDDVNPQRASSGSQFYIVQGRKFTEQEIPMVEARIRQMSGNLNYKISEEQKAVYMDKGGAPHLDGHYTVFGQVVSGMEVLDAIAAVEVNPQLNHRPTTDVRLITARVKWLTTYKLDKLRKQ